MAASMPEGRSLVIGATGLVGGYILRRLVKAGQYPLALSRSRKSASEVEWFCGDLLQPGGLKLPPFTVLYCTADAVLLAGAVSHLLHPLVKRVVVFSSTSVITKLNSEVAAEREHMANLSQAECRIASVCEQNNIEWTILRPTLIYDVGRDANITPLSRLIGRFGFMPVVGGGQGLRQPVHAEDLAIGAIAAASSAYAANKFYSLPGGETMTYREMIGRIFDGMGLPRRTVSVPVVIWRVLFVFVKRLFPGANVAMGTRMTKDLVFDSTPAVQDFDWQPRVFNPIFNPSSEDH